MDLSDAARELLLEAAGLRRAHPQVDRAGRGAFLKTNGKAFGDGSPDEQARWESGVRQLLGVGLVEPQGGRVFTVTPEGYQAADVLRRRR